MLKIEFLEHAYSNLDTKWKGQTFEEKYARLYCVTNGSAEIWHNKRVFELVPGSLFLVPPNANMQFRCRNTCRIIWLHFNLFIHYQINIFSSYSWTFVNSDTNKMFYKKSMFELLELIDRNDRGSRLRAQGILLELLSSFLVQDADQTNIADIEKLEKFKAVLNYIDKKYSEKLSLKKIARIAGYEKTYFSSLFKKLFSVSPMQYIIRKRVDKAKMLLRNTNNKLSSISEETGFNDAFHLSKTFKRLTGKPPCEFRKSFSKKIP